MRAYLRLSLISPFGSVGTSPREGSRGVTLEDAAQPFINRDPSVE